MTLSDALVLMAPPDRTLSLDEDARRQAATAMVYDTLCSLARRVVPAGKRDDVVNDVVLRLMKNRPGPRRYTSTDAEADQVLYDRAIPAIARTLREGDGFLATVGDIRAIAREATTIDEIVAREQRDNDTFVRTRNRIYQRQKRTRGYLLEVPRNRPDDVPRLSAWLIDAALTPEVEEAVRAVAHFDFAPRVQHGSGTQVSPDEVMSE